MTNDGQMKMKHPMAERYQNTKKLKALFFPLYYFSHAGVSSLQIVETLGVNFQHPRSKKWNPLQLEEGQKIITGRKFVRTFQLSTF